ncbi:MAG: hypothetical protein AAB606_02605 [Patescibacteria group bacterium]
METAKCLSARKEIKNLKEELGTLDSLINRMVVLMKKNPGDFNEAAEVRQIRESVCRLLHIDNEELERRIVQTAGLPEAKIQSSIRQVMVKALASGVSAASRPSHYPEATLFKIYWFVLYLYSERRSKAIGIYQSMPWYKSIFMPSIFGKEQKR